VSFEKINKREGNKIERREDLSTWGVGEEPEDDGTENKKERDDMDCILSRSETRLFLLSNVRKWIIRGKFLLICVCACFLEQLFSHSGTVR
jgi:hypothetical protein